MNTTNLIDKLDPDKVQCCWCDEYIDMKDSLTIKGINEKSSSSCRELGKCRAWNWDPSTRKIGECLRVQNKKL